MNIQIPHHWLLEYLNTKAKPETIAKNLSLCGPSVEKIDTIHGEPVYDIEVTTNRVDMMSVYGIAREASVILPEFGIKTNLKPLVTKPVTIKTYLDFTIKNDPKLCHRILAIKLENVQLGTSPGWLQKRLEQVGQRSLNNAIDITNYVTWELGHPIHAFDYDRLSQKTIIVRQAKAGEKLTTLDDITYTLKGGEVVFDDGTDTIVDLPGIMGTQNTVVTQKTKNVLLWIESIDPVLIRQASMSHAIRTQAAVLNEKSVDPELGFQTILRAIELFKLNTKFTTSSELVDIYPHPQKPSQHTLTQTSLDTYMGIPIEPKRVTRILTGLGCQVAHKQNKYLITPPSFRSHDLKLEVDYIEEIARIYGYHNLDSVIMDTPIPDNPGNDDFFFERSIKQWLVGWGTTEVYTYSMVNQELAKASGHKIKDHLKISNPLSDEWLYMRRSLVPSLVSVLDQNPTTTNTIFELQNVYHPNAKSLPQEELHLTLASNQGFPHLKGLLDALMQKLFVDNYSVIPARNPQPPFTKNSTGHIKSSSLNLGIIGQVDSNDTIYAIDINISQIRQASSSHPKYIPPKKQAPIIEDLTFTFPPKTVIGPVITTIGSLSRLIESVNLSSQYKQNYTFTIIYRHPNRPLKDKEILPIRKKTVSSLKKNYQAKLVGTLNPA